jgi:hypothetical protein
MYEAPSVTMVWYLQRDAENNSDLKEMITETMNRVHLTMASVSYLKALELCIPAVVISELS